MKKNLIITMLMTVVVGYTAAQDTTATITVNQDVIEARQCFVAPVTHWSIGLKTGANYFRVAPQPIKRMNQIHMIVGGTVEYSFSPLVGVGLEFVHNPFSRNYSILPNKDSIAGSIKGATEDLILYGSMNMANLLAPYRKGNTQKLNVYINAGFGYCLYKNPLDLTDPNQFDLCPMANIGANIEYNLSKSFAIELDGQYRQYHRKLVSGPSVEKSNALNLSIGIRYKFNARGYNQHARNISMCEYYPKPEPLIIEKTIKCDTTGTAGRQKAIEDEINALNDKINKLNSDKSGFLSTGKGTGGDNSQAKALEEEIASFENIQFEFDSDKLKESSYPTLDKIAEIMLNNTASVKAGVIGHTDYIGTEEYNQGLSLRRANAVRVYLLSKKVPAANVYIIGCGKEKPLAPNETKEGRQKNRRVEFKITM